MNLNFHIVDIKADLSFEHDFEGAAMQALMSDSSDETSLMALAELVDWEMATMGGSLTGQGKRCERALKQRILACDFDVLTSMAGRSGVINALFHALTLEAEALAHFHEPMVA